jgi:hypothetical protein
MHCYSKLTLQAQVQMALSVVGLVYAQDKKNAK